MQKVIIKNLGPLRDCEIELKKFMVFIGDSAEGKSIALRTISLLKWIYKKMQYKALLKHSKTRADALRFRLDGLLKSSMLDDFFSKESYIELIENQKSIIVIENGKLKPHYDNIKKDNFLVGKILFLNDIRSSLAEILSSPSGKRAKFSYYTNDMIENFHESLKHFKEFKLSTMDLSLTTKKKVGYEQVYLTKNGKDTKFEHASSGEKNLSILELICSYFANSYDFDTGFSRSVVDLISQKIQIENIVKLQEYINNKNFRNFMTFLIEEPEVNLFPQKQQAVTNFLSSIQKLQNAPEIIISTHSPYILMALNNLIYAGKLISDPNFRYQSQLYELIDSKYILNLKDFSALLLENGKAIDIIDQDTGLISADKLDKVSGDIMDTFYKLCEFDPSSINE
ncbi:MAG: hypothetical protein ACTTJC_02135 [Campylobacter sp.]